MIVNLVCIIHDHHCAIFVIPIEFMHSIIAMHDMQVNVAVKIVKKEVIYVILHVICFHVSLSFRYLAQERHPAISEVKK